MENHSTNKFAFSAEISELVGVTIKNVFLSSMIKSENLESLLAESVSHGLNSEADKIPYSSIQDKMNDLLRLHENIQSAEDNKSVAEDIVKKEGAYLSLKREVSKLMLSIRFFAENKEQERHEASEKLKSLKEVVIELGKSLSEKSNINNKMKISEQAKASTMDNDIKSITSQYEIYKSQGLEEKSQKLNTLPRFLSEKSALSTVVASLRSEIDSQVTPLEALIEKNIASHSLVKSEYENNKRVLEKEHGDKVDALKEEGRLLFDRLDEAYQEEGAGLEKSISEAHSVLGDARDAYNAEKHNLQPSKVVTDKQRELAKLDEEVSRLEKEVEKSKEELLYFSNLVDGSGKWHAEEMRPYVNIWQQESAPLLKEKERLSLLIEQSEVEGTVLNYILSNNLPSRDILLHSLDDKILLTNGEKVEGEGIGLYSDGEAYVKHSANKAHYFCELGISGIENTFDGDTTFGVERFTKELGEVEERLKEVTAERDKWASAITEKNNSRIREFEKNRTSLSKDISKKNTHLVELNSAISSEKIGLKGIMEQEEENKRKRLEALKKAYGDADAIYRSLSEENNKRFSKLKEKKQSVLDKQKLVIKGMSENLSAEKKKLADMFKEVDEAFTDTQKKIADEIEGIKKSGGEVDFTILKNKEAQLSKVANEIEAMEKTRDMVAVYNDFMNTKYNHLDEKKRAYSTYMEEVDSLAKSRDEEIALLDKKLKEEQVALGEAEGRVEEIEYVRNAYISLKELSINEGYALRGSWDDIDTSACREDTSLYYSGRSMDELRNAYLAKASAIKGDFYALVNTLRKYYERLSSPDIFKIEKPFDYDDADEVLRSCSEIREFIERGYTSEMASELITSFTFAVQDFISNVEKLERKSQDIERYVSDINKKLRDIDGIDVVKSIEIRTAESTNRVLSLLREIRDKYNDRVERYGVGTIGQSLFTAPDVSKRGKSQEDAVFLELFDEVLSQIQGMREKYLTIKDCFEIEFKVVENSNDSKWVKSGEDFGSNGTDTIVKTLIYITFIGLLKNKKSRRNKGDEENEYIHCIIDEVGTLYPEYLRVIVNYANRMNIFLINGLPTEILPEKYKSHYSLSKKGEKFTKVSRVVYNELEIGMYES